MADGEILCSHCRQPIAHGDRAVALLGDEPRAITSGDDEMSDQCYHATCFQIARVQRAIEDLDDGR
jgi:hypothetical protein